MNKTSIEWCDESWNPVSGCLGPCGEVCAYCYAKTMVNRWQGYALDGQITTFNPYDGLAVLEKPLYTQDKFGKRRKAAFPFGFDPTLYLYRLIEPYKKKTAKTIFVCSMSDLFGDWVPDEWIEEVFEACQKAPWHRYMFLTKNPSRYIQLATAGLLPAGDNYWYGSTVTGPDVNYFFSEEHHTFLSVEPILEPFKPETGGLPHVEFIILGAETGDRPGKVVPANDWIEPVVYYARQTGIPVFMKDSMAGVWDGTLITELPWKGK